MLSLTPARQKRLQKIMSGLPALEQWIDDVFQQGLASFSAPSCERIASRMVDAQASGLARQLRQLARLPASGPGWEEPMLMRLGDLQLAVRALNRFEALDPEFAEELLQYVGFTWKKNELPESGEVHDTWQVVMQRQFDEDRLSVMRSWLWGHGSKRWAMVLAYSVNGEPFDPNLKLRSCFTGALTFYPGSLGLRAVVGERETAPCPPMQAESIEQSFERIARWTQAAPWIEAMPFAVAEGTLSRTGETWWMSDGVQSVPLLGPRSEIWSALAINGNRPGSFFGEWNGLTFRPLTYLEEGSVCIL